MMRSVSSELQLSNDSSSIDSNELDNTINYDNVFQVLKNPDTKTDRTLMLDCMRYLDYHLNSPFLNKENKEKFKFLKSKTDNFSLYRIINGFDLDFINNEEESQTGLIYKSSFSEYQLEYISYARIWRLNFSILLSRKFESQYDINKISDLSDLLEGRNPNTIDKEKVKKCLMLHQGGVLLKHISLNKNNTIISFVDYQSVEHVLLKYILNCIFFDEKINQEMRTVKLNSLAGTLGYLLEKFIKYFCINFDDENQEEIEENLLNSFEKIMLKYEEDNSYMESFPDLYDYNYSALRVASNSHIYSKLFHLYCTEINRNKKAFLKFFSNTTALDWFALAFSCITNYRLGADEFSEVLIYALISASAVFANNFRAYLDKNRITFSEILKNSFKYLIIPENYFHGKNNFDKVKMMLKFYFQRRNMENFFILTFPVSFLIISLIMGIIAVAKGDESLEQNTAHMISVVFIVSTLAKNFFNKNIHISYIREDHKLQAREIREIILKDHSAYLPYLHKISSENTVIFPHVSFFNEPVKITGFYSEKGENHYTYEKQTFRRVSVAADGDCAYTAFGIARQAAFDFLIENLDQVKNYFIIAVEDTLQGNEKFLNALIEYGYIDKNTQYDDIISDAKLYSSNDDILRFYLFYDVLYRTIDDGWTHPAILQALAQIRNIDLRIWALNGNGDFLPHRREGYYDYHSLNLSHPDSRKDLLFVNFNHFEVLEAIPPEQPSQFISLENETSSENNPKSRPAMTAALADEHSESLSQNFYVEECKDSLRREYNHHQKAFYSRITSAIKKAEANKEKILSRIKTRDGNILQYLADFESKPESMVKNFPILDYGRAFLNDIDYLALCKLFCINNNQNHQEELLRKKNQIKTFFRKAEAILRELSSNRLLYTIKNIDNFISQCESYKNNLASQAGNEENRISSSFFDSIPAKTIAIITEVSNIKKKEAENQEFLYSLIDDTLAVHEEGINSLADLPRILDQMLNDSFEDVNVENESTESLSIGPM